MIVELALQILVGVLILGGIQFAYLLQEQLFAQLFVVKDGATTVELVLALL